MGPLSGLKVIELAHIMSGPTCGMLLADMGADVIKVEKVPGGDDTRRMAPPFQGDESSAFLVMNRNKRGIAIDLKTEGGKRVLRRMLATADVVTENYRAGTMEKLGFGYEALAAENPALIFCEISGYGRTGPDALKGGFDLIAQGESGLMSTMGEPGGPPIKAGAPVTDINAGILAALGVVSAYVSRLKTGRGQRVDTSLFEAGIMLTFWQTAIYLATGAASPPMGSGNPLNAPYQSIQTRDGYVNVGAANQGNWERLLKVLGRPELAADARFKTNPDRVHHRGELIAELTAIFRTRDTADWIAALEAAGLPTGPILSIPEMLAHPQTAAREMIVKTEHATLGTVKALGFPIKFSGTPAAVKLPAPIFGQHTREVLAEYGFPEDEVVSLLAAGAVVAAGEANAVLPRSGARQPAAAP